jgi:ligand-binding SRPBCC domain-containing protein
MGVSQQVIVEVLELQPGKILTIHQRTGPLKKWVHTTQFIEREKGTELHDRVEFEPPGGLLGLLVTVKILEGTIRSTFGFREKKLREVFK